MFSSSFIDECNAHIICRIVVFMVFLVNVLYICCVFCLLFFGTRGRRSIGLS